MAPSLLHEHALHDASLKAIAGIDEAGRGCWAGPVVAAAVVLGPAIETHPALLDGVDDSKKLSAIQRDNCYERIRTLAAGVGVGIVPAFLIDGYGILPATRLAMLTALFALPHLPDALLIDAVPLHDLHIPQRAIIRGDSASLSIAAASIIAKVTRDRLMTTAAHAYPGYSFELHKGYGTPAHQAALQRLGCSPIHRLTFRPIAALRNEHV